MESNPTVFVIDDDASVREALELLLMSANLQVESFASPQEFFDSCDPARPGCVMMEARLSDLSWRVMQERLEALGSRLPIVLLTARDELPAIPGDRSEAGALALVRKPFRDQELLGAARRAIREDSRRREGNVANAPTDTGPQRKTGGYQEPHPP